LQRLLEEYKGRKIATVCDDGESSDLQNFVCQENDLVMIGNEQFGLPMEIINGANIHKLSIQMQRKLNSLNISCAFSIISYEYMRQGRLHFTDK